MGQINWNDAELIQEAITNSKSRVETLRRLGYNSKGTISRRKLNEAIKKLNLDISSYTNRTERWNNLAEILPECASIADVLKAVGLSDQGDNFKTAKRAIEEMDLDTSHFSPNKGGSKPIYTYNDVFCRNSKVTRHTLKRWIIKLDLLDSKCYDCDISDWRDQYLTLEIDHINGINNDNRLSNLRYLCPNCHSITPTHRGKNRGV